LLPLPLPLPCLSIPVLCFECLENARSLLIMSLPAMSETVCPMYSLLKPNVLITLLDCGLTREFRPFQFQLPLIDEYSANGH
jgi:hypothetical protein